MRSNVIANAKKANLKKTLSSFTKVSNNITINKNTAKALPKEYTTSMRTIMESIAIPKTMYKFYVRVFVEDEKGGLSGLPSNAICVYYGEPGYRGDVKQLAQKMESNPAADKQKGEVFLDWNNTAALKKVMFWESGITRGSNFAYVYYQVTTQKPDNNLEHLLNPTGLVYSKLLSANSWFPIDFTTFAVKTHNVSDRLIYYVRAVNVYYDPDNIATATASVSTPLMVVYGEPYKPGSVSQTPTDDWSTTIDIATPQIQFVQYTAPDRGLCAGDQIIVTKVPSSGPFHLSVGQKESFSHLKQVLVRSSENIPWYEQLGSFFVSAFNGICGVINLVSQTWTDIQGYAVKGLAVVGIPDSVGGYLVNAALMAAGIPPSFPNANDLKNIGKGKLTGYLVEQAGGYIPESLASAVVDELFSQVDNAVAKQTVTTLAKDTGLDSLNGCVRPNPDFFCRNATITLTVSNPYNKIIPAGEFDLNTRSDDRYYVKGKYTLADNRTLFNPERIRYPALQPGQKMNITVSLEEAVPHYEENGIRFYANKEDWDYLSYFSDGTAEISGLKPNIPDEKELYDAMGLDYNQRAYIDFNTVINTPLPYIFGKPVQNSAKNELQINSVFVSTTGNDNNSGTAVSPYKTLDKAVAAIGRGGTVLVEDGTYEINNFNINKEGITISGNNANVIFKTPANVFYAFTITAPNVTLSNMEIRGSVKSTGDRTLLADLNVKYVKQNGIWLYNNHYSRIRNSEIAQIGTGRRFSDIGIYATGYDNVVETCSIHDTNTGVALISELQGKGSMKRTNTIRNSTVYNCTTGLRLSNDNFFDCNSGETPQYGISRDLSTMYQPYTIMASGCNIYKCTSGVVLTGKTALMKNCFIHDMEEEGVVFDQSIRCGISQCTLYNTGTPIVFKASKTNLNRVDITEDDMGYGYKSGNPYCVGACVIVENEGSNDGTMVVVENNENGSGLDPLSFPYMAGNYFYCKNHPVIFMDRRKGDQHGMRFYMGDMRKWNAYVYADYQSWSYNYEDDPKIDALGHSTIKDVGVQ